MTALRVRALLAALIATLAVVAAPAGAASGAACAFEGVPRIVAIGDVHGAYAAYLDMLRTAGIIDGRERWAGAKTHFVQVGDVVDRGDDSRKVIDLLRKLEREASSAGGRVHFLLGNHETMRMIGNLGYVSAGEYAAFTDRDSARLRQQIVERYPEEQRDALLKNTPLGMIELIRAYGPEGTYGSYLRKLNAVVRINGIVFLHGGISAAVAPMSCDQINDGIRRELTDDFEKTIAAPAGTLSVREDGPLWYRGLAREPETFAPELETILTAQQARAIVVGHTVTPNGRIQSRFEGRVFTIDTGLNADYVKNGRGSALEIQGGVFTAIYADGREILPGPRAKEDR